MQILVCVSYGFIANPQFVKGFYIMSIIINTNVPALISQNALTRATWSLNQSLERMSTGYRINSAADDPAGSYFASGLNTQIRAISTVTRNVQLASNMISVAEGDMQSIMNNVERVKDLAMQYSSDTLTDEQKDAIKTEAQQRIDEINRLAEDSSFNEINLLDGSLGASVRIQIGTNSDPATNALNITGVFDNANAESINLIGGASDFASIDEAFAAASTAAKFIDIAQESIDVLSKRISTAGIYQTRLESISDSLLTKNENLNSAYSTIMDTDIATETANYIKQQLLQQTASSMLSQANQNGGVLALSLVNALA